MQSKPFFLNSEAVKMHLILNRNLFLMGMVYMSSQQEHSTGETSFFPFVRPLHKTIEKVI